MKKINLLTVILFTLLTTSAMATAPVIAREQGISFWNDDSQQSVANAEASPRHSQFTVDQDSHGRLTPRSEPLSRYGNPPSYVVAGKRYHVLPTSHNYHKRGVASWYGPKFNGKLTSNREVYDMTGLSAASPELPIPSYVKVTNLDNGKQVTVRVNDRGPFLHNRLLDLSFGAAKRLGMIKPGTAHVRVDSIDVGQRQNYRLLYLQTGAFRDRARAQKSAHQLEQRLQYPIHVIPDNGGAQPLFRVKVGPLPDSATWRQLREQLSVGS